MRVPMILIFYPLYCMTRGGEYLDCLTMPFWGKHYFSNSNEYSSNHLLSKILGCGQVQVFIRELDFEAKLLLKGVVDFKWDRASLILLALERTLSLWEQTSCQSSRLRYLIISWSYLHCTCHLYCLKDPGFECHRSFASFLLPVDINASYSLYFYEAQ